MAPVPPEPPSTPSAAPDPEPKAVEALPAPSLPSTPRVVRPRWHWQPPAPRVKLPIPIPGLPTPSLPESPLVVRDRPALGLSLKPVAPAPVAVSPSDQSWQWNSKGPVLPNGFNLSGVPMVKLRDHTGYRMADLERRLPAETFAEMEEWLRGATVGLDEAGEQVVYLEDWEQWIRGGFPLD